MSAPSGAGKTSLSRAAVKHLAAEGTAAAVSVSYTTRPPRPGEENGVHYHFVTSETFERMIARDEFLEHAEVFGRSYSTAREATDKLLAAGQHVILDIDWQGGRSVRAKSPDAVSIFILPPSLTELERRLRGRGQDSDAVIAQRMARAREEMSHYNEYEHLIINRDFEQALLELMDLIRSRGIAPSGPKPDHQALIRSLLK